MPGQDWPRPLFSQAEKLSFQGSFVNGQIGQIRAKISQVRAAQVFVDAVRLRQQVPAMSKTLFEKIAAREIPATIVYEDDFVVAFKDVSPKAPVHVLIVPRKPIPRIAEAKPEDHQVLGHLVLKAAEVARKLGVADSGFRLVFNNGPDAGEAVPHLHCHIIGGRKLGWPPG